VIYFVVFLFIGSMFLINLFIVVILVNFKLTEQKSKSRVLTDEQ